MTKPQFHLILIFLAGLGCDVYNDTGYKKQYIVESYLVADRSLPKVRISHSVPADQAYSVAETTVSGADVSIALLENGSVERRVSFEEDSAGMYRPMDTMTVEPRRTYRLRADIGDGNTVTTETTVPNSYRLTGSVPESVAYQSDNQIEVTLIPDEPDTLNRQKKFVFNIISNDHLNAPLTPFYADQLENEDIKRIDFRNNSSGLVSEDNFTVHPDGSVDIRVPWIGFVFYGPNQVVTNSIDENLYDFIRSHGVQTGGSTLSPGEIPNVIYHVDGGIGIFGSMTSDTVSTFLMQP